MGTVNVNRSVSDAFYRYKMPRILAKVEGKGNGIKTVLVNMTDVAKALGRPATYPTKYFGCELGALTRFDVKSDRFIVNGSHDASKLQDLLDGFIRKFVLCPQCDNPETTLIVQPKKSIISQACKACGYHAQLDFNHKLNTFILKNPPDFNPASQGSSLTEGKRHKKNKKNGESNGDANGDNSGSEGDHAVQASEKDNEDDDEAEWAVDVSEEAVRARMQDLTDGAKGLTLSDDLEKTEKERMDLFYSFVKQRRDAGVLEQVTAHREVVGEAEHLEIKSKAPLVLAELLFDDKIHLQMKKYRVLFLRFTHDDLKAQKYLMGGIEQIIAMHKDTLLAKVPAIFKLFYDADILDEKVLLEWAGKVSKKYVNREMSEEIHASAEPFIKWLKEAEEEESDSEEEDSDDDLEIEYDDRAKTTTLQQQQQQKQRPKAVEEEDGDDVDIDAI